MSVVDDIADFLRGFLPFAEFDPIDVRRLAESVEIEFFAQGEVIFSQGAQPVEHLRVIRTGVVEVVDEGRVLDVMGPGEIFGHASMLSGLPTGFTARAAEDTLTYRIPSGVAAEVFAAPRGLRYLTRRLLEDHHHLRSGPRPEVVQDRLRQPVRAALRGRLVMCAPTTTLREAADLMTRTRVTALVIDLGESLGIVTDADLRERVVATGRSVDEPVSAVMTAPAITVPSERSGSEVLIDMLDLGVRHFPVVSPHGEILGVVEDHDLVDYEKRTSFSLRRAVALATSNEALIEIAPRLRTSLVELRRGGAVALDVMSFFSVVADALTRRALDLAVEELGEPPARFAWVALGSEARREALPSSDLDSAIVWLDGPFDDRRAITAYLGRVTTMVTETLRRCGLTPDRHRVSASDPLFVRAKSQWRRDVTELLDDPTQDQALIVASVLTDSRAVWGVEVESLAAELIQGAHRRPALLRLLAQFALVHRPPSGFARGNVLETSGESRAGLDLKNAVVVPITDLARWAGMAAGVSSVGTLARLDAGRDASILSAPDAQTLRDAFELASELRLDHQVAQLEAGVELDDVVDLAAISPLTRSYLKESFRAVASIQRRLESQLPWIS